MNRVRIFDFVDEHLNVFPRIMNVERFYLEQENPEFEYYTYDKVRSSLDIESLMLFFTPGFSNDNLRGGDAFSKDYSLMIEEDIFRQMNKDYGRAVKNYEELVSWKKASDYCSEALLYEEVFERVQENFFEAGIGVFYSKEANELIETLKGDVVWDIDGLNGLLMDFYQGIEHGNYYR